MCDTRPLRDGPPPCQDPPPNTVWGRYTSQERLDSPLILLDITFLTLSNPNARFILKHLRFANDGVFRTIEEHRTKCDTVHLRNLRQSRCHAGRTVSISRSRLRCERIGIRKPPPPHNHPTDPFKHQWPSLSACVGNFRNQMRHKLFYPILGD